ncbi:hypothetical protein ACHWQZ_G011780 [Mnemiopsis leidyi]
MATENDTILKSHRGCTYHPHVLEYLKTTFSEEKLEEITTALSVPPKLTTIRVNSLHHQTSDVISNLKELLNGKFDVTSHPSLADVVVIAGKRAELLETNCVGRVIVNLKCGKAVLRGADIFSPGVKGLPHLQAGCKVSVHVDVAHKCKRGEKNFTGSTVHIANGILKLTRFDIFKKMVKTGIAVQITERNVELPSLSGVLENQMFLQNLPSIVASHVLNPQPGDHILDMCSAPGGKTTHIAQLMGDMGTVIALEKVQNKVDKLETNIRKQNLNCIKVFKCDSTKVFSEQSTSSSEPPLGKEVFDKILLDPPCSALGQRPQLGNDLKLSEISSYPSYQWCFVADAIKMLKYGGTLVYSTCTLPKQENEMIVARVLSTFPEMILVSADPLIGQPGILVEGLSDHDVLKVQRFLPSSNLNSGVNSDTIGFFIAKFEKIRVPL